MSSPAGMIDMAIKVLAGVMIWSESLITFVRQVRLLVWRTLLTVNVDQSPPIIQGLGVSQPLSRQIGLGKSQAGEANKCVSGLAFHLSFALLVHSIYNTWTRCTGARGVPTAAQ